MQRRRFLLSAAGLAAGPLVAWPLGARAATPAPGPTPTTAPAPAVAGMPPLSDLLSERSLGQPTAKVTVTEWFSLTCTHCANFDLHELPTIQQKLIDSGDMRIVFRDFPLDQVALEAAMVARALPPSLYVAFIRSLFASQDRWAFAPGVNSTAELRKMAELAGMAPSVFDAVVADEPLRRALLEAQAGAEKSLGIDSTPTFVVNGKTYPGETDLAGMTKMIGARTA